ncbi:uncharacterized protein LOC132886358 [Neoarius graeffei]|uniref:uncharacterized protein LOC132886358 n=1 Tax=Neoarius graeffei TaxID=443677 RepID=UPI00298CAFFC|nr:uncharacterized protein LOC132886358 [Neoarius graeffei]
MSCTLHELYKLLGIKSIPTSVYHLQIDGLVEQFNQTLKDMICKFVHRDAKNWDRWLDPLLLAVREVPQASTGFSPFELLYGHKLLGVLDIFKENWEEEPSQSKNEIQYVLDLRAKLHALSHITQENLLQAQEHQAHLYNRGAWLRELAPGDKVLIFLATSSSKLLAKWQGPFELTWQIVEVDYEVKPPDRADTCQIYHLNLLKPWREEIPVALVMVVLETAELGLEVSLKIALQFTLVPCGEHLSPPQRAQDIRLQEEFSNVFSPFQCCTKLIQHHINSPPGVVVHSLPYWLPKHKKNVVWDELQAMLKMGGIEELHSNWSSLVVLVPKTDGSVQFCVDYRKVNAVSKFAAFPMPCSD